MKISFADRIERECDASSILGVDDALISGALGEAVAKAKFASRVDIGSTKANAARR